MDKKILIVVGIVFALVFTVLLAMMFSSITTQTSKSSERLADTFKGANDTIETIYANGGVYKGSEVIAFIQNKVAITGDSSVTVKVNTSSDGTAVEYTEYTAAYARNRSDSKHIDPSASFKLATTARANGTTQTYTFTVQ